MFYLRCLKKYFEKIFSHFLFFGERYEWMAHFPQIKWAMWANRSFRSPKMSDHEQFAQRKWAIVSQSLRFLTKMSESLIFLANHLFAHFWTKTSDSLGNLMSEFPALILPPCQQDISSRKKVFGHVALFFLLMWAKLHLCYGHKKSP